MKQTKPRALIESAFLVGIATILSVVAVWVPLLGLLNFVLPAPFALLGKRHGALWSGLALVVTTWILTILMGPLHAFVEMGTFGLTGFFLGLAYRYNWSPLVRLAAPTVIFIAGTVLQYYAARYILGVDVIALFHQGYTEVLNQFEAQAAAGGPWDMATLEYMQQRSWEQMLTIIPAVVGLGGLVMAYLNNYMCELIFNRLRIPVEPFPPLLFWRMPRWLLVVFGLSLYAMWKGSVDPTSAVYVIGMNVGTVTRIFIYIEGLAFVRYLFYAKGWPAKAFWLLLAVSIFFPLATAMFIGAGIMEMIMRIRKREGLYEHKEEVMRDLRK